MSSLLEDFILASLESQLKIEESGRKAIRINDNSAMTLWDMQSAKIRAIEKQISDLKAKMFIESGIGNLKTEINGKDNSNNDN